MSRILQSLGLLSVSVATALVTLFVIDRVVPSPIVLLPLLVTAPAMIVGLFVARRRSISPPPEINPVMPPGPRLESIVFVSPLRIGSVRPHPTTSFAPERKTA